MKTKIAYACAGEGRGHVTGMIAVSQLLMNDFDITFFAPDTVADIVREHFPDSEVYEIPALQFAQADGKVDIPGTLKINREKAMTSYRVIRRIAKRMIESGIEAVVSDFEPYTALAGNYNDLPLLHLNHPGIVLQRFSIKHDAIMAKAGASIMMPPSQKTLITSFYEGDVGPILRKEIRDLKPVTENHFLVYVKPDTRKLIEEAAARYPKIEFRFFPDPDQDFLESLRSCKAVIAPGGHQMLSEALHLNKPIMVFPIENQYEQRLNSKMLNYSGRGITGDISDVKGSLQKFIDWMQYYPSAPREGIHFCMRDDTPKAAKEIKQFILDFVTEPK